MRLNNYDIKMIKQAFKEVFGEGEIYLFGSRVDEAKKGGDIDLYIDSKRDLTIKEELKLKQKFRLILYERLGEQKIDIIISKNKNKAIEQEALKTGIKL